jgi:hypothetical protein
MTELKARKKIPESNGFSDTDIDDDSAEEIILKALVPAPVDLKKVFIRSLTASTLALFFLGLLQAGHFYCILLGVLTQTELYRELVNVRYVEAKERSMPAFRTLQWSWFFAAMLFVYGETLRK